MTISATPNPGSDTALESGCRCSVFENAYGRGYFGDGEANGWIINANCPLHGEGTATWDKWQEEEGNDERA